MIFLLYCEYVVMCICGVDLVDIIKLMCGVLYGGWDLIDFKNGNIWFYMFVLGL